MVKVLAAAGDAGGASALVPVVRRLRGDGAHVDCRAYAAALGVWERAGLDPTPLDDIALEGVDRILLGTTVGPRQAELEIIERARVLGIRTVSVVDFWANYRERFTTAMGAFVLPDVVAVMDEPARADMIARGFPSEAVVATGQPAVDELDRYDGAEVRAGARARLARFAGGAADDRYVTYVSQPLSALFTREALGYTEVEVLAAVIETLGCVLARRSATAHLVVKLHPRETATPVTPSTPGVRVHVMARHEMDARELLVASDLVVGMNSMLLMEACLLRLPVVSYQPGLRIPDPLRTNSLGGSRGVFGRDGLESALDAELFDPAARAERRRRLASIVRPGGASARVASLVMAERGTTCHA